MARVRSWLVAAVRLLGAIGTAYVALVLLFALLTGLVLVPVFGLGVPVVAGALGAIRALADLHRRVAGDVLGARLVGHYTSQPGWSRRELLRYLRDPQNGRDAIWLVVHGVAGLAAFWVGFALLVAVHGMQDLEDEFEGWDLLTGDSLLLLQLPVLVIAAVVWWTVPWAVRGFALLARLLLAPSDAALARRVEQLTESRAATVDALAAELRRIERDLHDGAQARLAAVGMTLGLAAQVLHSDPDRAAALLQEGRSDAGKALAELRDLVRGIHPPVLADRGLAGGLEAAALLCPVPVTIDVELPARPQAPVESALYFAAAEALTNIGRHSGAASARLHSRYANGVLTVAVTDDGHGGADPRHGTGLRGIERRLAAFDGTLRVSSPPGGPTEITMELPCTLTPPPPPPPPAPPVSGRSSPRTTYSSGTA